MANTSSYSAITLVTKETYDEARNLAERLENELQLERERNQKLADDLVSAEAQAVKFYHNYREAEQDHSAAWARASKLDKIIKELETRSPSVQAQGPDGTWYTMQPGDDMTMRFDVKVKYE